jgi:hypothetical protein
MKKIIEFYKEIADKKDFWNYYNNSNLMLDLQKIDDIKYCCEFIKSYINTSNKFFRDLDEGLSFLRESTNGVNRPLHIISTFLLGLGLYHNNSIIRSYVTNSLCELKAFRNNVPDKTFAYIWFMACFFHDFAYMYEDRDGGDANFLQTHKLSISRKNCIPPYYKKAYKAYFDLRSFKDHGIIAGTLFDENVCAINEFNRKQHDNRLSWRKDLLTVYHYVANIIMAHNIWLVHEDDENINRYRYEYDGALRSLIYENDTTFKFKFTEYPFFTLFCIVDSIEPSKATNDWRNIKIDFSDNKIILECDAEMFIKRVLDLNKWLLCVERNKNNQVVIILN